VDGKNITVDSQTITVGSNTFTISGSGSISGNILTITYEARSGGVVAFTCEVKMIKI
jgi:hypothetical protein